MRLYRAICAWLEASAATMTAEHAHSYTQAPELHAGHRGQSVDDDDGGVYRAPTAGFAHNA